MGLPLGIRAISLRINGESVVHLVLMRRTLGACAEDPTLALLVRTCHAQSSEEMILTHRLTNPNPNPNPKLLVTVQIKRHP